MSGSAHVLKAILEADVEGRVLAVGGKPVASARSSLIANLHLLRSELSVFGRGARFMAPVRELLKGRVARQLTLLATNANVSRIVSVFPDAFYCEAALQASRQAGKPLDLWFHNTYADNRKGIAGVRARRLESELVEAAERIFLISDALRDRFAEKYPHHAAKFEVLRHPVPSDLTASPRTFSSHPIKALLMGNLNESNLDAAIRMIQALGGRKDIHIRLCTPVPKALLGARGMDVSGVDYRGYVSDEEMNQLLADNDLFLLPHGLSGGYSEEEYRTIFPTRAAHYLAQGGPILAHAPAGSGLERFLRERDCAVTVTSASTEAIVTAFESLVGEKGRQLTLGRNALLAAESFAPTRILNRLLCQEEMQ